MDDKQTLIVEFFPGRAGQSAVSKVGQTFLAEIMLPKQCTGSKLGFLTSLIWLCGEYVLCLCVSYLSANSEAFFIFFNSYTLILHLDFGLYCNTREFTVTSQTDNDSIFMQ